MPELKSLEKREERAFWSLDISEERLSLGSAFSDFFDCKPNDLPCSLQQASSIFSEKGFTKLQHTIQDLDKSNGNTAFQFKTKHHTQNGSPFSLQWMGEVIEWSGHTPQVIAGQAIKVSPAQLTLRQKAFLFDKLMNHLPDSIFFKDRDSRFLAINKSCADKFGLEKPEEAAGKTDFDIFDNQHAQDAFDDEQHILETKEPIINKTEKEVIHTTGEERWASTSKFPLMNANDELVGTFGITRDVTEKVSAENKLKLNKYYFDLLTERAPGFLYLHRLGPDGKSTFPYASDGLKDLFEVDPAEIKNGFKPLIERMHEADLEETTKSIQHSISTQEFWDHEYRIVLPNKGVRWVRGRAKPIKMDDGSVISPGYITDITDQKEAYESIARLREQLQQVIDFAPNLIFVKDLDGTYLMANESAATFFDTTTNDIVGKKDVDLGVPEEQAQHFLDIEKEVIRTNRPSSIPEFKTTLKDGTEVWHQTIKVPFLNTDSGKPAMLSVATNITALKQKEIELKNSLDIIGDQNKRLTNFAHIVSHNLRNHAGNISMLLSLYDMEESGEEKEVLLEHLGLASKRLNESIADLNEIIDQQYKTTNDQKELNLRKNVDKIKEILTTETLANNVRFEEDIPENLTVKYNSSYLESILLNLLSNAIKYRHPGRKPIVSIKAYEQNDSVFLEIADNGLGIDMDKYGEKLFGMYNTFHSNENSKGIGLFITKNQIESMGGSIEVESEPDKGTTFKIEL